MKFNAEFIEKVRQASNLVELVGQHSELKRSGSRLMGRCPLPGHGDKTPSFSVSEDSQLFHCFGCKKSGNIFHFLEYQNGLSFPDAVEFLARRAGIPLPENSSRDAARPSLGAINKAAAIFYYKKLQALPMDSVVWKYAEKRGLSRELVEAFRLGYATAEWSELADHLRSKRYDPLDAEKLGLIRPRKTGNGHYDLFRERLIFPIFSSSQEVIGFGGRTFGDDHPKYLNSPETPLFHKSRVLYGIHETAKYIRSQDEAIVVEGYMDLIGLYAAGIRNVVAILGTAFTVEHARALKKYTKNIKILLDGDDAGFEGAERSLPILMAEGLMPKALLLPDELDPDEYVRSFGADKLRSELARAVDLFYIVLERKIKKYGFEPSDKIRLLEDWSRQLNAGMGGLQDPGRGLQGLPAWQLYLQELARRLAMPVDLVRRVTKAVTSAPSLARNTISQPNISRRDGAKPQEKQADSAFNRADDPNLGWSPNLHEAGSKLSEKIELGSLQAEESELVSLMFANEECFNWGFQQGFAEGLTHDGLRRLLNRAHSLYYANGDLQKPLEFARLGALLASEINPPSVLTAYIGFAEGKTVDHLQSMMTELWQKVLSKKARKEALQVAAKLKTEPSAENMEKFMELQRKRLSLKNPPNESNSES